jgi:hypothetical protein
MVDQKYKKTYPILWTKRKIISYSFDDWSSPLTFYTYARENSYLFDLSEFS